MASRSTFRSAVSDVAWQRQLRDRYAAEGTPPVPHLDLKRAVVRPVSRRIAEQVILKYEWLGTMTGTARHYGLFFGPFCAGVCCVSVGSGTVGHNVHRPFGVERHEMATLARGACVHWAPPGSNSKLVAWSCRMLARESAARVVIAYADTDAGEVGTIYQAAGWAYVGCTESRRQMVAPNGRIYDEKIGHDRGKPVGLDKGAYLALLTRSGWTMQPSNPKHRYVCVLDRSDTALVERVERMRQPYPKRDMHARAKHPSDAPAVQAGEGGAAPTRTLQEAAV